MKRLLYFLLAALLVLAASCDKDNPGNPGKYGIDGKTPLPEAVDIGLVVDGQKVLWANFNLGASKEWELGDYYAWGETDPYYSSLEPLSWKNGKDQGYDWASYSLANGSFTTITKYCQEQNAGSWAGEGGPDNLYELLPEDDAAHKKLGGEWKIPSKKMFEALLALEDEFPPAPMEAYHAFYMYFNPADAGRSLTGRYYGLTIRPVCVE